MPIEKRTRIEIFLPLRSDLPAYQIAIEWITEEFAYLRGGATLTAPFTGFFASSGRFDIIEDAVRILFCDLDQDLNDDQDRSDIIELLESTKSFLTETLEEEEIWIVFYRLQRIA